MSPEEERPIAEPVIVVPPVVVVPVVVAAQEAPLTQEEYGVQMQQLTDRAKAAGLSPLRMMAQAYLKQGEAILEGVLDALEEKADNSKKKGGK